MLDSNSSFPQMLSMPGGAETAHSILGIFHNPSNLTDFPPPPPGGGGFPAPLTFGDLKIFSLTTPFGGMDERDGGTVLLLTAEKGRLGFGK